MEIIAAIGMTGSLTQAEISAFEQRKRVPSFVILLHYARVFGVHVDDLIGEEIDLEGHES